MATWTRITDADEAVSFLPAWLGSRMIGQRGKFGLLLSSGEILKITSIAALHQSAGGIVLLDVSLDHAGAPDGIDLAWQPKHYLGAPVLGAAMATVNLAHVVAAVAFIAEEVVNSSREATMPAGDDVQDDSAPGSSLSDTIERANKLTAG
jgi:hypothetical protein